MSRALSLLALVASAAASPFWDYIHNGDTSFAWRDTGKSIKSDSVLPENSWTGYLLNVTSQKWLTPADFNGQFGHVWTHQVRLSPTRHDRHSAHSPSPVPTHARSS